MKLFGLFKILAYSALIFSCSGASDERDPRVFRYNEASGISSLDPAFARVQSNIWAVGMIFNTLVELDAELNITPGLAKSWSTSPDGLEYRFALRRDVFFHPDPCFDQAPETRRLRATDVVFSLYRLSDAATASSGAWIARPIDTVWAIGEDSLIIRLNEVFPPFLATLANAYCGIVSRRAVEIKKGDFGIHPVGTGAFVFKRWLPNEKLILRRNNEYFERDSSGAQLPYLEAVSIRFLPDRKSSFLALLQDQVDFISGLDPSYADELLDPSGALSEQYNERLNLLKAPYLNTEYLGFGIEVLQSTAWSKPEVRRAFALSVDREGLVRYLRRNVGIPASSGMVPPALNGSLEPASGWSYQPEKAAELLVRAGYPKAEGIEPLRLYTSADYVDLAEFVQSSVSKLGFAVEIEVMPTSSLRDGMANARFGFFRASWIADYPEAENYLLLFSGANHSPNGPNYTHFSNSRYDEIFKDLQKETSEFRRKQLARQLEAILLQEVPAFPLFYDEVVRVSRPGWRGLEPDPLNRLDLRRVRFSLEPSEAE